MKKTLKILLIFTIALALAIVLAGCGKKEDKNSDNIKEATSNTENNATTNDGTENNDTTNNTTTKDASKSKTYNTFKSIKGNFVISVEGKEDMGNGEETITMTVAVKDKNTYMDVKSASQHATIIYKDNITYIISHDEKAYMSQEGETENVFDGTPILSEDDLKEIETEEYKVGKEKIDGTEYEYEEYKDEEENTTARFYFLGDELRYMKEIDEDGTENLMKINNISSNVDDSLFEIPTDYQKMEI